MSKRPTNTPAPVAVAPRKFITVDNLTKRRPAVDHSEHATAIGSDMVSLLVGAGFGPRATEIAAERQVRSLATGADFSLSWFERIFADLQGSLTRLTDAEREQDREPIWGLQSRIQRQGELAESAAADAAIAVDIFLAAYAAFEAHFGKAPNLNPNTQPDAKGPAKTLDAVRSMVANLKAAG